MNTRGRKGRPRTTGSQAVLGGDHVEGQRAVREVLLAGRRRIREVLVGPRAEGMADLAADLGVPVRSVSDAALLRASHTSAPQGVIARCQPVDPVELSDLVGGSTTPLLLVVDSVTDPQNLGALLRSAECAGVTGVVLARHRSVRLTPAATKAAAGAVEHLRFCSVGGIPAALQQLGREGLWAVGLEAGAPSSLFDLDIAREPLALVLGSEDRGLRRLTRARCDKLVAIPTFGNVDALNVGVAGALACYEVARRRQGG